MGARAVRGGGESLEEKATFDVVVGVVVSTPSMKRRLADSAADDVSDADDVSGGAGLRSKMAAVTVNLR